MSLSAECIRRILPREGGSFPGTAGKLEGDAPGLGPLRGQQRQPGAIGQAIGVARPVPSRRRPLDLFATEQASQSDANRQRGQQMKLFSLSALLLAIYLVVVGIYAWYERELITAALGILPLLLITIVRAVDRSSENRSAFVTSRQRAR